MLKKIVMGLMLIGLIGVLVVGGMNRTADRLDRNSQSETDRQARPTGGHSGAGSGYRGGQQASLQAADVSMPLGQQNQGSSRGQGRGGTITEADSETRNTTGAWSQVGGFAQTVSEDALTLILRDGDTLVIEGRAWRYAGESGFAVQEGDRLTVLGFYEEGAWKTAKIENHTMGLSVILRFDSGRPMWAGRGRQG